MDDSQLAPCPFGYLESERFRIRVRKWAFLVYDKNSLGQSDLDL